MIYFCSGRGLLCLMDSIRCIHSFANVLSRVFLVITGLNRKFGISDEWFATGGSLILTVLGQVT
jgi:hypothetical protein